MPPMKNLITSFAIGWIIIFTSQLARSETDAKSLITNDNFKKDKNADFEITWGRMKKLISSSLDNSKIEKNNIENIFKIKVKNLGPREKIKGNPDLSEIYAIAKTNDNYYLSASVQANDAGSTMSFEFKDDISYQCLTDEYLINEFKSDGWEVRETLI